MSAPLRIVGAVAADDPIFAEAGPDFVDLAREGSGVRARLNRKLVVLYVARKPKVFRCQSRIAVEETNLKGAGI